MSEMSQPHFNVNDYYTDHVKFIEAVKQKADELADVGDSVKITGGVHSLNGFFHFACRSDVDAWGEIHPDTKITTDGGDDFAALSVIRGNYEISLYSCPVYADNHSQYGDLEQMFVYVTRI